MLLPGLQLAQLCLHSSAGTGLGSWVALAVWSPSLLLVMQLSAMHRQCAPAWVCRKHCLSSGGTSTGRGPIMKARVGHLMDTDWLELGLHERAPLAIC